MDLDTLNNVNLQLFKKQCEEFESEEIEDTIYPALSESQLVELEGIIAQPLPADLRLFLSTDGVRAGLDISTDADEYEDEPLGIDYPFFWIENDAVLSRSREIPSLNEEYDWSVPPCVVLSEESSEVIAYRVSDGQIIHIEFGSDGEVTELDLDLPELISRWIAGAKLHI